MYNIIFIVISLLFIGCTHRTTTIGKVEEGISKYKIEDLINIERTYGGSFSPDYEKIIYISNKTGIPNIWIYNTKTKERNLYIESKETIQTAFWNKLNHKIYYTQDTKGNENFNVFEYDPKTKISKNLIGNPKSTVEILKTSRDFSKLFYLENNREKKRFDFYSFDFKSHKKNLIWKATSEKAVVHYIEKTNTLLLFETLGDEKEKLYSYDINSKKEVPLLTEGTFGINVEDDDIDGDYVYLTSNKDSEFYEGYKLNLKTKELTKIISDKWDIVSIGRTFNKKYYYYIINENGSHVLSLFSDEFKTKVKTPNFARGQFIIENIDRDEKHAAFTLKNDSIPSDIFLWNLENNSIEKITNNLPDSIRQEHLVSSTPVTYKARDGLTIHGFLYLPKGAKPEKGYPALVMIHGGPKSQFKPYFNPKLQYLLNNGYAILAPNVRGSTGHGSSFHMMDNLDFGGKPLLDVLDGKNYLAQMKEIDSSRIGIYGGSYGGYMVLAALAFAPNEFKLGIDLYGPSNLITLVKSFPTYWAHMMKYVYEEFGDPKKDYTYMRERSPLFSANKIGVPLLIFHGKNDVRVLLSESQSIYDNIKKRNGTAELYIYDDEGHGFYQTKNRIDVLKKTIVFLNKYL